MVKIDQHNRVPVVFYHRKPRSVGNYSLEFIFDDVRTRLKERIAARTVISKYESKGVFLRLYNCLEALAKKGPVNHITGDVNYLGIFLSSKNTINTILDCVHLDTSSGLKYKVLKYFWLALPERHAKFLTAISESTKREILKHHPCDPDKIVVIPVAISPEFQFKAKEFNKQKPRILQVGAAPNKNIPRLIEALKGIPCVLNIVGKINTEYEQMCRDYGIDLIYESGLSNEEMIQRYEICDIVSLASTYEGFGMPILEAQAVGRAVISSNLFSMPEVAGDSAVLVDPFNTGEIRTAILKIISDDTFREDRIRKGFENIKRFDPELIANQYFQLYEMIYKSNS
jgi:glycosyltransferase involved in cell wall biosynthesis